ncbi:MAG: hypothetical protein A2341_22865 [Deltaproteobacteria bacterium RIFOXYB12_FULL_58_9]|nr:MAG: hypothetical protein A2341_22865 [Deltaproteobacteria bacterium RIFOXYB12_FULL_58_9]
MPDLEQGIVFSLVQGHVSDRQTSDSRWGDCFWVDGANLPQQKGPQEWGGSNLPHRCCGTRSQNAEKVGFAWMPYLARVLLG